VPLLITRASGDEPGGVASMASGAAVVAAGVAIYAWCVFDFIARGQGTPNPYDAPRDVVVTGLYRVVRNPMYVGVTAVIAGQAVLFRSPWLAAYAGIVLIAFHLRVVLYEEPTLARSFGASWDNYRARVPRWLPRFRGR
jgi:protein-S-isoprenylcysteine O-methyltransferase Ste14